MSWKLINCNSGEVWALPPSLSCVPSGFSQDAEARKTGRGSDVFRSETANAPQRKHHSADSPSSLGDADEAVDYAFSVGRSPQCALQIPDRGVSRLHGCFRVFPPAPEAIFLSSRDRLPLPEGVASPTSVPESSLEGNEPSLPGRSSSLPLTTPTHESHLHAHLKPLLTPPPVSPVSCSSALSSGCRVKREGLTETPNSCSARGDDDSCRRRLLRWSVTQTGRVFFVDFSTSGTKRNDVLLRYPPELREAHRRGRAGSKSKDAGVAAEDPTGTRRWFELFDGDILRFGPCSSDFVLRFFPLVFCLSSSRPLASPSISAEQTPGAARAASDSARQDATPTSAEVVDELCERGRWSGAYFLTERWHPACCALLVPSRPPLPRTKLLGCILSNRPLLSPSIFPLSLLQPTEGATPAPPRARGIYLARCLLEADGCPLCLSPTSPAACSGAEATAKSALSGSGPSSISREADASSRAAEAVRRCARCHLAQAQREGGRQGESAREGESSLGVACSPEAETDWRRLVKGEGEESTLEARSRVKTEKDPRQGASRVGPGAAADRAASEDEGSKRRQARGFAIADAFLPMAAINSHQILRGYAKQPLLTPRQDLFRNFVFWLFFPPAGAESHNWFQRGEQAEEDREEPRKRSSQLAELLRQGRVPVIDLFAAARESAPSSAASQASVLFSAPAPARQEDPSSRGLLSARDCLLALEDDSLAVPSAANPPQQVCPVRLAHWLHTKLEETRTNREELIASFRGSPQVGAADRDATTHAETWSAASCLPCPALSARGSSPPKESFVLVVPKDLEAAALDSKTASLLTGILLAMYLAFSGCLPPLSTACASPAHDCLHLSSVRAPSVASAAPAARHDAPTLFVCSEFQIALSILLGVPLFPLSRGGSAGGIRPAAGCEALAQSLAPRDSSSAAPGGASQSLEPSTKKLEESELFRSLREEAWQRALAVAGATSRAASRAEAEAHKEDRRRGARGMGQVTGCARDADRSGDAHARLSLPNEPLHRTPASQVTRGLQGTAVTPSPVRAAPLLLPARAAAASCSPRKRLGPLRGARAAEAPLQLVAVSCRPMGVDSRGEGAPWSSGDFAEPGAMGLSDGLAASTSARQRSSCGVWRRKRRATSEGNGGDGGEHSREGAGEKDMSPRVRAERPAPQAARQEVGCLPMEERQEVAPRCGDVKCFRKNRVLQRRPSGKPERVSLAPLTSCPPAASSGSFSQPMNGGRSEEDEAETANGGEAGGRAKHPNHAKGVGGLGRVSPLRACAGEEEAHARRGTRECGGAELQTGLECCLPGNHSRSRCGERPQGLRGSTEPLLLGELKEATDGPQGREEVRARGRAVSREEETGRETPNTNRARGAGGGAQHSGKDDMQGENKWQTPHAHADSVCQPVTPRDERKRPEGRESEAPAGATQPSSPAADRPPAAKAAGPAKKRRLPWQQR